MASIIEALRAGLAHQQAGRLAEAEQVYRQVLAVAPAQSDALHLLGLIARERGQLDEAADWIRRAIDTGRVAAPYLNNLGVVYQALGKRDEALDCFRRAIELRPDYAEGLNNLSTCLQARGDHEQALATVDRGLALHPQMAELWINRGITLQALRRYDEARAAFDRGIALKPHDPLGYGNLGLLLRDQHRLDEARAALERAIQLDPAYATAHSNLATTLRDLRLFAPAELSYRRAIELRPEHAKFHFNLANLHRDQFRYAEAEQGYRRALALDPQLPGIAINLAILLQNQGRLGEARELFDRALTLDPTDILAHNNRLMNEAYQFDSTPERLGELLDRFQQQFGDPLESTWRPHTHPPDIARPLRIGFVSADLGVHPIGRLMTHVFRGLDPTQFQTVAYSNRTVIDEQTQRLKQHVSLWYDVADWTDDALAEQIRRDAIDILVDLSGHTAGHRLLVFARRPAPVQVTWMGFAASTGLRAIDWLLTDAQLVPPESERYYRERIWRMPLSGACYEMPADAPAVNPPPSLERGYVTLGCFNNPAKFTEPTLVAWGQIMQQLPTARLVLKYQGLHDPGLQRALGERLSAAGVDLSRVTFEGMSPLTEMLRRYQDVDLALDPFPYTGGTTSLLASWMGVPVV
ncbi:MAG: tetratricopeptide repeat protein, partial [Planctomycetaceae bacterium]|nr:tetratricopeptide repeat protein [Planctomycetaceae bacterium]